MMEGECTTESLPRRHGEGQRSSHRVRGMDRDRGRGTHRDRGQGVGGGGVERAGDRTSGKTRGEITGQCHQEL